MEFCPHCRAMRRSRKTTRSRQEVRDGQEVTIRTHTYHCAQCSRFLYSNDQVQEPVTPAAESPAVEGVDETAEPAAPPTAGAGESGGGPLLQPGRSPGCRPVAPPARGSPIPTPPP